MSRRSYPIGTSPFAPIADFRQFATDPTARVRLKEVSTMPNTFDLVTAINASRAVYEALISVRGAVVGDGDPIALLADANARCQDLVPAIEDLPEYLHAAIMERDRAAMAAVEGGKLEAAE